MLADVSESPHVGQSVLSAEEDRHGLGELADEPEETNWSSGAKEKKKEKVSSLEGFTRDVRQALPVNVKEEKVEKRRQQQQGGLVRQDTDSEEFDE